MTTFFRHTAFWAVADPESFGIGIIKVKFVKKQGSLQGQEQKSKKKTQGPDKTLISIVVDLYWFQCGSESRDFINKMMRNFTVEENFFF